jgi:sialate O-acetylesterase
MKTSIRSIAAMLAMACLTTLSPAQNAEPSGKLRLHAIFDSDMVLQRDKPITIWGWAEPDAAVSVQLGNDKAEAKAAGGKGRWEVTLPARAASADPQTLTVTSGGEKVEMGNVVIGDVWVMYGQSNMAYPLRYVTHRDTEALQGNIPNLRLFTISNAEQADPQEDIAREKIDTKGWIPSTPKDVMNFSAIGYVFGAQLHRSLNVPIGIISSARGGASLEALVPARKYLDNPSAKSVLDHVAGLRAKFDREAEAMRVYGIELAKAKSQKLPEDQWPKKPEAPWPLSSWNVPGQNPGHPGSVYNGMFGAFAGFNLKGVLLHHGYNNAMSNSCRPKFYRWMMKSMMEGIREDFKDPKIAFGIIGFCAGGETQNEFNFEVQPSGPPFIREAQRLGVADMKDPQNIGYIPGYDVQIPGLHPTKKREHGERAARWALSRIYSMRKLYWDEVKLVSAVTEGDEMILTFDMRVQPDDMNKVLEGFSLAGEDKKFYMAHARHGDAGKELTVVHVWSPMVPKPVALRYAWGFSPMGNLKVQGHPDMAVQEFRTDNWDLLEPEDMITPIMSRGDIKAVENEGIKLLEARRIEEAKRAPEIMERLKTLGQPKK